MGLRVAIFGLGRIGKIHYHSIKKLPQCFQLTVLFDINYNDLSEQHTEPVHDPNRFNEWVGKLDAILVCSPTHTHYQIIRYALLFSLHVLVVYPPSKHLTEITECYQLARQRRLILMTGINHRYDPGIRRLRQQYKHGKLGSLQNIILISRNCIYHDCMIHNIDSLCWILDEYPNKITREASQSDSRSIQTRQFHNVGNIIKFPSGIIATINNINDIRQIDCLGEGKSLVINHSHNHFSKHYQQLLEDFYHLIIGGNVADPARDRLVTQDQCIRMLQLIDNLEDSVYSRL